MSDRRPLDPDVLAHLQMAFGSALATHMQYDRAKATILASELDAAWDRSDLWMAFRWSGQEILASVDNDDPIALSDAFALDVATSLKETRARSGRPLPWDG